MSQVPEPHCVAETHDTLGESVLWHPLEEKIYWLDLKGPAVHRLDPATGQVESWNPGIGTPMGTMVRTTDGFVLTGREGTFRVDFEARRLTPWVNPNDRPDSTMFNDGKVDRQGRLWLCTSDVRETEPLGGIYCLGTDGTASIAERGFACGNGPAFSLDGRTFYFADTMNSRVYAYDIDPGAARLANRRLFAEFGASDGMPDGMTVDAAGGVWICHWGGGQITRHHPDGSLDLAIRLPAPLVTSCAFAGRGLETLYITTATVDMDAAALAGAPLSGSLFAVRTGHQGVVEPVFGLSGK